MARTFERPLSRDGVRRPGSAERGTGAVAPCGITRAGEFRAVAGRLWRCGSPAAAVALRARQRRTPAVRAVRNPRSRGLRPRVAAARGGRRGLPAELRAGNAEGGAAAPARHPLRIARRGAAARCGDASQPRTRFEHVGPRREHAGRCTRSHCHRHGRPRAASLGATTASQPRPARAAPASGGIDPRCRGARAAAPAAAPRWGHRTHPRTRGIALGPAAGPRAAT